MAKVYRVDVSGLSPEQKQDVEHKLRAVSFIVLNRMTPAGLLIAFDAVEAEGGNWPFKEPEHFKSALGLPGQCAVIDVTGWNLLP